MKKILLFAYICLACLSAQAQRTVKDNETEFGLKNNDIVTISREANRTRIYLTVNDHGEIITHNEPNENSLWQIHDCAYKRHDWGDQNVYYFKHHKTNKFLYVNATGTGGNCRVNFLLGDNPSEIHQNNPNGGSTNHEQGRFHYYYDNKDFIITINNNAWVFQQNVESTLQVEKWTQTSKTTLDGYFSPEAYDFTLAKSAEDAANQKKTIRFVFDLVTEKYFACARRQNEKQIVTESSNRVTDLNTLSQEPYNIIPTFKWQSSNNASSTFDVKDFAEHASETNGRIMMKMPGTDGDGAYKISSDGLAWEISVTPEGASPMGLKKKHNNSILRWANYLDTLVATCHYNDKDYTFRMRVARKAYHTVDLPAFEYSVSPSTYTFESAGESADGQQTFTFTIKGIHQHGIAYYDADERLIEKHYDYRPVDMPLKNDGGKLKYEFKCVNRDNPDQSIDWLTHDYETGNDNNTITLTAQKNETSDYRQAQLIGVVELTATQNYESHPHTHTIKVNINQRGSNAGNIALKHYQGISYASPDSVDKNRRQQVHTAERTIYYTPDQDIQLRLAESNFFGYMRWYDYASGGEGGDPYWNPTESNRTSWTTSPRGANGDAFKAINTSYGNSRGLYATAQDGQLTSASENNPAPVLKGWKYNYQGGTKQEKGYHTIACDVSAYTDYKLEPENSAQRTSITEPTLSYRQLFHLKPAEEIAESIRTLSNTTNEGTGKKQYLENYHYMAPVGVDVHLATQYRYAKSQHESELCYFFFDKDNKLHRIGKDVQAKWYKNGTEFNEITYSVYDYLTVDSDTETTDTYELKVPAESLGSYGLNYDLLIAKFEVEYVDRLASGPSAATIITDHDIESHYVPLKKIDFNLEERETTFTFDATNNCKQRDYHLPWDESTYGYYYPKDNSIDSKYPNLGETSPNRSGQNIPYYGEYFIVNRIHKDWAQATAHGGGDNNYALYVDGTTESGVVASISTDAVICAGQTLYCSAWFCNPCPTTFNYNSPRNPIFRCNVQGRMKEKNLNNDDEDWGEWEDISVFFVGQLEKGSGWQQVVFPVKSDKSYDETRVSIYNFATGGSGNDFMVDDICLFASRLPLAAYQAQTSCASDANTEASTAAILRIDFTEFQGVRDKYMYYQIYNTSTDEEIELREKTDTTKSAYYHDNADDKDARAYGSITIPVSTFNPRNYNDSVKKKGNTDTVLIFKTVQNFKDYLVDRSKATDATYASHAKAYIKSNAGGEERWLLYVMHIIPNVAKDDAAQVKNTHLREDYQYSLRMANTADELDAPECNMQTPLLATQATHFNLYNVYKTSVAEKFIPQSKENCPNDYYILEAEVQNLIAKGDGGSLDTIESPIMGDWLIGYPFDDVYTNTTQHTPEHKDSVNDARELFKTIYGYYREEVTTAILYDLRRQDPANTNLLKTRFEDLDAAAFEHPHHYTIIKDLYENGFLYLGNTKTAFYLAQKDTARYWFFPIDGTATTTMKDAENNPVTVVLHDCSEPVWVRVISKESEDYLNIAPLTNKDKTPLQKRQLPTVRVLQGQLSNVSIPITERGTHPTAFESNTISLNLNESPQNGQYYIGTYFSVYFVDPETGVKMQNKPDLTPGTKHVMCVQTTLPVSDDKCNTMRAYFNLLVLPNRVVWAPTTGIYDGWGLDGNWSGWNDKNNNGQIEADELMEGYTPIAGSEVIIGNVPRAEGVEFPTIDEYAHYPYVHDHNHYPMDVHASPFTCGKIYFAPGAHIHNQHLLQYEQAFVDMPITKGDWYMMSAPLQNVYSGDMYIPHSGASYTDASAKSLETTNPFEVSPFNGSRKSNAPYAFWASYYNQSVDLYYTNGSHYTAAAAAEFKQSNSLVQPLASGFMLLGEGPDNLEDEQLVIRLPKPDKQYTSSSGNTIKLPTTENRHKLAFTGPEMSITLTNGVASQYFIFGNPTMAFINMNWFLESNDEVLENEFSRVWEGTMTAETEHTMSPDALLAPMTAVLLKAKGEQPQEITVTLKAEHLTLDGRAVSSHSDEDASDADTPANAPRRASMSDTQTPSSELMTVYAITKDAHARAVLAVTPVAHDYYQVGEDAVFMSSGIENNSYVTIPLNMYTVAEQVPMMADVRQGISNIPLAILAADKARTDYMQLAFYLSHNWSRECYLHDTATGQKTRIMDGLVISVEMPANHAQRYVIEGPDEYLGSSTGGTTTSTENLTSSRQASLHAYSKEKGMLTVSASQLIRELKVYTLTGQLMAQQTLSLLNNTITLPLPTGVYVVEATLQDGTILHTQSIVR